MLEKWDSKENQLLLMSRFTELPPQKSFTRQDWNSFKKENYSKIKEELGEKSKPKDVMAELSKRWKSKKLDQSKQIIPYNPLSHFFTSLDLISCSDDDKIHKILNEMLKDTKNNQQEELPTSPKSKKNLENEEVEEKETKSYNSFFNFHFEIIKAENLFTA